MATLLLTALAPTLSAGLGIGLGLAQTGLALVGGFIDRALLGSMAKTSAQEGPRLESLKVTSSSEGTPVLRVYGKARIGGQLIWASKLKEVRTTEEAGGGKGVGGGGGQEVTKYTYFANFAVGLCEGEISGIGRIWADGKEINLSDYTFRLYKGTSTQMPDSLIESVEGSGNTPAYRGLAYIVFENMPLEKYGNRVPNFNFEVFRLTDGVEKSIKAVTMLPGSGEFAYATQSVERSVSYKNRIWVHENYHTTRGGVDWTVGLNDMQSVLVNAKNVALIVAWFGTDLRCGNCTLTPKVDRNDKTTRPIEWQVAGLTRTQVPIVSLDSENFPAYGGTPSDNTVVQAIQDMNARGLKTTFYPFIMMDVPPGNTLPDPYSASGVGQSLYPWRGRITLSKAPGVAGSPDKTGFAYAEVAAFVAQFRNFILHYANLCASAGGVDAFYIGTEMRGMTTIRDNPTHYPFVDALVQLAADVKAILPASKITYGADWSEYFGHQPQDGSGDVFFHLDPLWASPNVSAIAIDCYWPLADWRKTAAHLDRQAGFSSIYDSTYLKSNVQGGEGYSWYYASQAHRDAQIRTPITDVLGKPWVFRYKDIKSWWSNYHYNRIGGIEQGTTTAWVPQSKEFWFSEVGCPSVDLGSNQPNVFYDPKSVENASPYYSSGVRDDYIQRRHNQCFIEFWNPAHAEYIAGSNPLSGVYGGTMVNQDRIYIYTWDARPYPAFPYGKGGYGWRDGYNWQFGHWINGRLGAGSSLDAIMRQIMSDYGWTNYDIGDLAGQLDGFIIDRVMSVRDAINSLEMIYFFDTFESDGTIKFRHRGSLGSQTTVSKDLMVESGDSGGVGDRAGTLFEITRLQETDLPLAAKLTFSDGSTDYSNTTVESRRLTVRSDRISTAAVAVVSRQAQMQSIADILLHENWAAREKAKLAVPPSLLFLEPTDLITVQANNREYLFRITGVEDGGRRQLNLMQIDPTIYTHVRGTDRTPNNPPAINLGPPVPFFMDLPLLRDTQNENAGYIGMLMDPWPGSISVLRSPVDSGYQLNAAATGNAIVGTTLFDFYNGPTGRWDRSNVLIVEIELGTLSSTSDAQLLAGANTCAIWNQSANAWEVLQFAVAELIAPKRYKLSKFLRGQLGSERAMGNPVGAGADFCILNGDIVQTSMIRDEIGQSFYWKYGPSGRNLGDPTFNGIQYAFRGEGLRPYKVTGVKLTHFGTNVVIHGYAELEKVVTVGLLLKFRFLKITSVTGSSSTMAVLPFERLRHLSHSMFMFSLTTWRTLDTCQMILKFLYGNQRLTV
jgi:hypothetical protein